MVAHKGQKPDKAQTICTTITPEQMSILRKEFPAVDWRLSDALRTIIKDYFDARNVPWPEDNHVWGGWEKNKVPKP